jgi:Carboxypeptidase regulatory-like domain
MNKIILPKSLILSLVGVLLVTPSLWVGATAVEGVVKDPSGRPVAGADVQIEAKNFSKIVKTDARGHYVSNGLAVGTYKVTLVMNGQVKASILDAKTQVGKATQLNFDLTGKTAPAKKHTHMVYAHPDVDSHIGGGRWIEVDDNGNPVNATGATNVQKVTGAAVQATQIKVHSGGGN